MNPLLKTAFRFAGSIAVEKVLDKVEVSCDPIIRKNKATMFVWHTTRALAVYSPNPVKKS